MRPLWRSLWLWLVVVLGDSAFAGGSGLNVIVVVNQNSTNSVQLGNEYCEKRGVPPQNFLRINWIGDSINFSTSDFESTLLDPLLAMIGARHLSQQSAFVLLSMDIPYRVSDGSSFNSTTSDLFYGFKQDGLPPGPGLPSSCSLPDSSSNSYCYSELPLEQARPNNAPTNSFLAMMLTDSNYAGGELVLARGVASDASFPTQAVYLEKTDDWARNVRYLEFDNTSFESRVAGDNLPVRVDGNSTSFTNALGLLTGLATFNVPPAAFVPGALADTLTSFGGYLFENSGQTPLLAFLEAGASASYGTIVEPCNYLQKFPDPIDYFYQRRGFSVAEAYYQSLQNPYQGLLAGEPLAAPFAVYGAGEWITPTNGAILNGLAPLSLSFASGASNAPLDRVDLFVDGNLFQTLTNVPPTSGNRLEVSLNGSVIDYQVSPGDTLASTAAGLATALNLQTNLTRVQAWAAGDRLQLQGLEVTNAGSNISCSANAQAGTAQATTIQVRSPLSTFLDTIATGYVTVQITNTPILGDWVQCQFVKTNGIQVVLAVTNTTAGTTLPTLVQNLFNQLNTNPDLQSADGCYAGDLYADNTESQFLLYARSAGWAVAQAQLTITASTNLSAFLSVFPTNTAPLQDNLSDLRPRNHLYLNSGVTNLKVTTDLDTRQLSDGFHEFTAVAYEGSSVRTQTRVTRTILVQNTALNASFAPLVTGTNVTLETPLQFAVTANSSNISTIEFFSTGGSIGIVSNQASALITAPSAMLGLGLHPFYAVVSDQSGNKYQTQTIRIRLIPGFTLTISGSPPVISWPTLSGQVYDVLTTTDLTSPFQVLTSFTATNSLAQWPVPAETTLTSFYRVRLR